MLESNKGYPLEWKVLAIIIFLHILVYIDIFLGKRYFITDAAPPLSIAMR